MAQGDVMTVSDPATPIEVSFTLRYVRDKVSRLDDPGNFAALRFGAMAAASDGSTIEIPGAEVAEPPFRKVQRDGETMTVLFTIRRARYEAARDGRIMLYAEYGRSDGSPASPENDRLLLGYARLDPGTGR